MKNAPASHALLFDLLSDVTGPARLELARRLAAIPSAQARLAAHPDCPAVVLDELAGSSAAPIRRAVAANPRTAKRTRARLAGDKAASVRAAAEAMAAGRTPAAAGYSGPKYAHTPQNVERYAAQARAVWTGSSTAATGWRSAPHVPLAALVKADPAWRSEPALIDALLGSPSMRDRAVCYLAPFFTPEAFGAGLLRAATANKVSLDDCLGWLVTSPSLTATGAGTVVEYAASLAHVQAILAADPATTAKLATSRPVSECAQAVTSTDPVLLVRLVREGALPAALAAARGILPLPDLLAAAASGLDSEGALINVDEDQLTTVLPLPVAEQILAAGAAERLVDAGDEAAITVGMLGLLPGLQEASLLMAAKSPSAELREYAARAAHLPDEARLLLAGNSDPWVRRHILERPDCTSADILAAIGAGEPVRDHLISRLSTAELGALPWQQVRAHARVRKAAAKRLAPLFAARPESIDVVAAMSEGFDGTVDEMVDSARLL